MAKKDTITLETPPLVDDQAGESVGTASPLAALALEASGELEPDPLAAAGDAGQPTAAAPPAIPNAKVFAQLLGAVRDTVCMVAGLEAPKRTLTDEKVEKLGEIWGGVFDHYGITLADKMGKYGPIFAAALATIPLVSETVIETRKEITTKDSAPAQIASTSSPAAASTPARGYVEGQVRPAFNQ